MHSNNPNPMKHRAQSPLDPMPRPAMNRAVIGLCVLIPLLALALL